MITPHIFDTAFDTQEQPEHVQLEYGDWRVTVSVAVQVTRDKTKAELSTHSCSAESEGVAECSCRGDAVALARQRAHASAMISTLSKMLLQPRELGSGNSASFW
jgi:hypothetical protein